MAGALKSGPTAPNTKASIPKGVNTGKAAMYGQMDQSMWATGKRTKFTVRASTSGLMADAITAIGQTTTWTGTVCTHGKMVENTRVSINETVSMVSALTPGRTDAVMKDNGRTVANMARVYTGCQQPQSPEGACGWTENDKCGRKTIN